MHCPHPILSSLRPSLPDNSIHQFHRTYHPITSPKSSESDSIYKSASQLFIRMPEVLTEMEVDITQYMRQGLWGVVDELVLVVRVRVLHFNN